MTDKFGPKAHAGIPTNIFLKIGKRTGNDGKRKRHLFSLPSVPPAVRSFPLSPDPTLL